MYKTTSEATEARIYTDDFRIYGILHFTHGDRRGRPAQQRPPLFARDQGDALHARLPASTRPERVQRLTGVFGPRQGAYLVDFGGARRATNPACI